MKKIVLCLLPFVSLACDKAPAPTAPAPTTPTAAASARPQLPSLTPAEVDKRRAEKNVYVFDNNRKERFDQGHVPGAKWVRPAEVTAAVLPADKTATLVFYCANTSCGACHEAAEAALKLGYTNVFVMPEGIAGWEGAKLPTEKTS